MASDFAELGHPAFVRSIAISLKQRREVRCLARWTENGQREKLAPLADEIVRRMVISIGYPDIVRRSLAFEHQEFAQVQLTPPEDEAAPSDDPESPPPKPEVRPRPIPAECARLSDAYAKGGMNAAHVLLGAAPTGLISLPSPGTCLAYMRGLPGPDGRGWTQLVNRIRKAPADRLPLAERDAILRDLAVFKKGGTITFGDPQRTMPLDDDGPGTFLCFGAITALRQKLQRPDDEPIDMIDDHVHLFRGGEDMLDELDADMAEHPEKFTDPKVRAALGLTDAQPQP
ncbi:MAG: hypothetical protein ACKOPO_11795 [Novosphingobium sp.]